MQFLSKQTRHDIATKTLLNYTPIETGLCFRSILLYNLVKMKKWKLCHVLSCSESGFYFALGMLACHLAPESAGAAACSTTFCPDSVVVMCALSGHFEVTAVTEMAAAFAEYDALQCGIYQRFGRICCLHLQDRRLRSCLE